MVLKSQKLKLKIFKSTKLIINRKYKQALISDKCSSKEVFWRCRSVA
jgi:hypothetical protein